MPYDYDALVKKIVDFRRQAVLKVNGEDEDKKANAMDIDSDSKVPSRLEALQGAMETFEELSGHCPMTPLLWIQYGSTVFDFCQELAKETAKSDDPSVLTASASTNMETQIQIVQLGLQEFPGSLLLQFRAIYLLQQQEELCRDQTLPQAPGQDMASNLNKAIREVGRGSHISDGQLIVSFLYEPLAREYAKGNKTEELYNLLVVDQGRRPLPNEGLISFFHSLCKEYSLDLKDGQEESDQLIDQGRRLVSKLYDGVIQIQQLGTDIQALLHTQRLVPPLRLLLDDKDESAENNFWRVVLGESESPPSFGMGYGGMDVAESFVGLARALARFQNDNNGETLDEDETTKRTQLAEDIHELSIAVYERGVSECPTVELIWTSYMDQLQAFVRRRQQTIKESKGDVESLTPMVSASPQKLLSVSRRACRNCPYSLTLVQRRLEIQAFLANHDLLVMDPESMSQEIVQPALASGFLPAHGKAMLYLTILRIIQQRILHLLVSHIPNIESFDVALDPSKQQKLLKVCTRPIPEDAWTEIQDLMQDFAEMATTIEDSLSKSKTQEDAMVRSLVYEQKAMSLDHVIEPLMEISPSSNSQVHNNTDEMVRLLQKASKLQNPVHPDTQLAYIRHFFIRGNVASPITNPVEVVLRLCHVRFLFEKAVSLSGLANKNKAYLPLFQRDHQSALKVLAEEWVIFENQFGTPQSVEQARKTIDRKFRKLQSHEEKDASLPFAKTVAFSSTEKRPLEDESAEQDQEPASKKMKSQATPNIKTTEDSSTNQGDQTTEESSPKERLEKSDGEAIEQHDSGPIAPSKSKSKQGHYVKVKNLEYPAHPFTVRVFDLAESVEDMDLVDFFQKSKCACGKIVFARILREKDGASKKWGLVQFEERESVEKALALSGNVGLHEQTFSVERSHMPATPSIVPAGRHRVKPQGQGKSSKQNAKKKVAEHEAPKHAQPRDEPHKEQKSKLEEPKKASVLSFVPRKAGRRQAPKKNPFKK